VRCRARCTWTRVLAGGFGRPARWTWCWSTAPARGGPTEAGRRFGVRRRRYQRATFVLEQHPPRRPPPCDPCRADRHRAGGRDRGSPPLVPWILLRAGNPCARRAAARLAELATDQPEGALGADVGASLTGRSRFGAARRSRSARTGPTSPPRSPRSSPDDAMAVMPWFPGRWPRADRAAPCSFPRPGLAVGRHGPRAGGTRCQRFAASLDTCDQVLPSARRLVAARCAVRRGGSADAGLLERVDVVQPVSCAVHLSSPRPGGPAGVEPDAVLGHSRARSRPRAWPRAHRAGCLRVVAVRARLLRRIAGTGAGSPCRHPGARRRVAGRAAGLCLAAENSPPRSCCPGAPRSWPPPWTGRARRPAHPPVSVGLRLALDARSDALRDELVAAWPTSPPHRPDTVLLPR